MEWSGDLNGDVALLPRPTHRLLKPTDLTAAECVAACFTAFAYFFAHNFSKNPRFFPPWFCFCVAYSYCFESGVDAEYSPPVFPPFLHLQQVRCHFIASNFPPFLSHFFCFISAVLYLPSLMPHSMMHRCVARSSPLDCGKPRRRSFRPNSRLWHPVAGLAPITKVPRPPRQLPGGGESLISYFLLFYFIIIGDKFFGWLPAANRTTPHPLATGLLLQTAPLPLLTGPKRAQRNIPYIVGIIEDENSGDENFVNRCQMLGESRNFDFPQTPELPKLRRSFKKFQTTNI